jgi:hypothetical protein
VISASNARSALDVQTIAHFLAITIHTETFDPTGEVSAELCDSAHFGSAKYNPVSLGKSLQGITW